MELTLGPFEKAVRYGNLSATIVYVYIYTELDKEYY